MDRINRVDQVFGFLLGCGGIPGGIDEEVINGNDAAVGQNLGGVEDILDRKKPLQLIGRPRRIISAQIESR